jgi:hypothetical protein
MGDFFGYDPNASWVVRSDYSISPENYGIIWSAGSFGIGYIWPWIKLFACVSFCDSEMSVIGFQSFPLFVLIFARHFGELHRSFLVP